MTFKGNLESNLEKIQVDFKPNNVLFFLDITVDTETIQIAHSFLNSEYLDRENQFGFSIYLPFDNMEHELSIFKTLRFFSEFSYFEFDGIPCFDLNCGLDKQKVVDYAIEILEKVFKADLTQEYNFEINSY